MVDLAGLQPPAELLLPVVEQFVSAAEVAAHSFDQRCRVCLPRAGGEGTVDCIASVEYLARCRWRDARTAWLIEHGVPRAEHGRLWPSRRPTWRTRPSLKGEHS